MQRQMLFRLVCTAAVLWIAIGAAVAAQSATATLTGTISDETGGVVSGVTVSVLNAATLQQRTTKTSTEAASRSRSFPRAATR